MVKLILKNTANMAERTGPYSGTRSKGRKAVDNGQDSAISTTPAEAAASVLPTRRDRELKALEIDGTAALGFQQATQDPKASFSSISTLSSETLNGQTSRQTSTSTAIPDATPEVDGHVLYARILVNLVRDQSTDWSQVSKRDQKRRIPAAIDSDRGLVLPTLIPKPVNVSGFVAKGQQFPRPERGQLTGEQVEADMLLFGIGDALGPPHAPPVTAEAPRQTDQQRHPVDFPVSSGRSTARLGEETVSSSAGPLRKRKAQPDAPPAASKRPRLEVDAFSLVFGGDDSSDDGISGDELFGDAPSDAGACRAKAERLARYVEAERRLEQATASRSEEDKKYHYEVTHPDPHPSLPKKPYLKSVSSKQRYRREQQAIALKARGVAAVTIGQEARLTAELCATGMRETWDYDNAPREKKEPWLFAKPRLQRRTDREIDEISTTLGERYEQREDAERHRRHHGCGMVPAYLRAPENWKGD